MAGKKRRRIRKRGKNKTKLYFHAGTQAAIVKFQEEPDHSEKSKIYESEILPAFDKLVENLILMHGFAKGTDFLTLKLDCITFLYETLYKFDESRGTKAFSYFNVVAKNWLIIQSKKRQKNKKRHVNVDDHERLPLKERKSIEGHHVAPDPTEKLIAGERAAAIHNLVTQLKRYAKNENEKACLKAIETVFSRIDDLDFFNKRALYVYMREISGLSPKQLSVAMSSIRKYYREMKNFDDFDIF